MPPRGWVLSLVVVFAACGDDGGGGGGDDGGGDDAPPADGGPVTSCDPPGAYGVPENTFDLPTPTGTGIVYQDIQAAFPAVDWQTLDRLYLPAGRYTNIQIGNLPTRTADRPLVITNKGGQLVVGFNPGGNYIWSFGGGANWILTGRHDAESQTGDAAFPGHACGNYANSAGTYGILSDDDYALDAPYLHMGLAVGGGATDFTIEYVEIARSGFAGIRLLNDNTMNLPMANVRIHDTYIHDVDGEGVYFGWTGTPPSNQFPGLQFFNNRILRAGNEALQTQDLGDGTRIYNNAFISGGTRWLDNGLGRYQDSNSQVVAREGTIEFHHNLFIDAAGTWLSFFSGPQGDDGPRNVTFRDNYFSDAASLGIYLNGTSGAGSTFTFENNTFRGLDFAYGLVDTNDPDVVVGKNNSFQAPTRFVNNTWFGTTRLVNGVTGGDGAAGNVTLTGNRNEDPGAVELHSGPWSGDGHHLTRWTPTVTVTEPDKPASYRSGDIVSHGPAPTLYRATSDTTSEPGTGGAWEALPRPTDDVRVKSGTRYEGYGVQ